MPGEKLNFGTSVLKREGKSIDQVAKRLKNAGWKETGAALNGRLRYFELAGINITALGGPMGTTIFPSGPIRGRLFGEDAVGFSTTSSIGAGDGKTETKQTSPNPEQLV